jgi:hypothetical protein
MTQDAILVIYGLGKDTKPRLARFAQSEEDAALRAAHAMGLGVGRAETPEAIALAKNLPAGKPYATGKSLLPLAKKDTYDKLLKAITPLDPELVAKALEATPAGPASQGSPWSEIRVGSVVLALDPEPGPERSYWPAVVTEVSKDGRTLFMRWKNFPTPKPFSAKRVAVGLIAKIH